MAGIDNLIPIRDSKRAAELGSKGGKAKLGSVHINTIVQELMLDPDFDAYIRDPKSGWKKLEGIPAKAIVKAQMLKALEGNTKAYDSLVKSGWTQKQEIEHSGSVQTGIVDPVQAADYADYLKNKTKSGE